MSKTCTRRELPARYNENERKLGRSQSATYREEGGEWILILDLDLTGEKK